MTTPQTDEYNPPSFISEVTKSILGAGITNRKMVSRDEARNYLNVVAKRVAQENWTMMVILGYMGEKLSWKEEDLIQRLHALKHDIIQIKIRLQETAQ